MNYSLSSVLLKNCRFIIDVDDKVSISPNISIKVTGFEMARSFETEEEQKQVKFTCTDYDLSDRPIQYQSPQILSEESYDARKADIWSLGMIFFHAVRGEALYTQIPCDIPVRGKLSGYWAAMKGKLTDYVRINNLQRCRNKTLSLLNGLLDPNETNRLSATDVLRHPFFKTYYERYHARL